MRRDCTTQQLTGREGATTTFFLTTFPLAYTQGNGVGAMESIIPSHTRTPALGITHLPFSCTLYSYSSSHNMVVLSLYLLQSSDQRAAYSLPLVENDFNDTLSPSFSPGSRSSSDGGADTHSFTTSLAQLRLCTHRTSPCSWDTE